MGFKVLENEVNYIDEGSSFNYINYNDDGGSFDDQPVATLTVTSAYATDAADAAALATSSKLAAEAAKVAAEAAQAAAEIAKSNAETAENNAETAETNAETAETNATNSASSASTSETNAQSSASSALAAKVAAEAAQAAAEAIDVITDATVSISTLTPGSSATASVTATNGTGAFSFGIPKGLTGDQGIQGIQGIQGPAGNDGADSTVAGPAGGQGPIGPQGPEGAAGGQGNVGSPGPAGPQGLDGPQGIQGENGSQGIQGPQGSAGPIGATGAIGPGVYAHGRTNSDGTSVYSSGFSVSRISTGIYQYTLNTALPNTEYSVIGNVSITRGTDTNIFIDQIATTGFRVQVGVGDNAQSADVLSDKEHSISVFSKGNGPSGLTDTYDIWIANGNTGTESDFLSSLVGAAGPAGADSTVAGPQGPAGTDGSDGAAGPQGIQGAAGPAGADGADADTSNLLPLAGGAMTGAITTNSTFDGRDIATDGAKLDGIETGATADQTSAQILTSIKTVDGASSGLDADLLDGQHGSYYTNYADTAVANLADSAPATLNTLNELAAALGDDANFSTTVTNSIATKLPKAGGTMTGDVLHGDNIKAKFGTGNDLEIYHDGSHSVIHDVGEGHLKLLGQDLIIAKESSGAFNHEYYIYCATDSSVFLYYDGSAVMGTVSGGISVIGDITVSGDVDGRDVATDGTKLDTIEANATADQTKSDIDALGINATQVSGFTIGKSVPSNAVFTDTNTTYSIGDGGLTTNDFTNADHSKLNGIETGATADQTNAEIRAAVEAASDSNVFTDADHSKLDGIATSANNYTHPNHTGEVTSTSDGATVIADNVVDEANLKVSNTPTNGYVLTAQSGNTGGLTWAAASGGGSSTLDGLSDVSTSGVTSGQVLKYNGTNWTPASDNTGSGGGGGITTGKAIAMAMVFG